VGGIIASFTNTAVLYDPVAQAWTPTGSLFHARYGHTATLLKNGKVLVAGGLKTLDAGGTNISAHAALKTVELYDPARGEWFATGPLHGPRMNHTATLLRDGRVLVAGGYHVGHDPLGSAELYDPDTQVWTTVSPLDRPRVGHTATLLTDGRVLVAGGGSTAEVYDPATGAWTYTGSLRSTRGFHTATLIGTQRPVADPYVSLLTLKGVV